MKKFLIPLICSAMALLCGCNINFDSSDTGNNNSKENLNFVHQKAKWTYLFYMPADNSLDSCVHDDLKEIEQSHFDDSEINMIALVDRSNKFKQGIDNWCGSRLYEMHPCVEGQDEQITSKRLSAMEFGVSSINDNPLDMGSAETLDAFIRYAKNYYPAEHYAIVIWGHGTGYRFENNPSSSRAVALDENSGTYLPMPELRKALSSAAGDNVFDFNGDGKLDAVELAAESSFLYQRKMKAESRGTGDFSFETDEEDMSEGFSNEDQDFLEQETGYDYESLELMDEWERREILEDAGLDADDYDFR